MRLTHKSQSALEYMMTYGWAILIIVIVAVILYSMGIFNPSSSVTFTSSGFSPFVIQSTVCTADGLAFSVLAGPISSQVVQINRVYLTSASGTNSTSVSYILPKAVTLASGSSTLIVIPGIHCSAVGIKFSSSGSIEYSYSTPAGNEVLNATGTITGTTSSAPAKLPSSIEYFIPITISNKQSSATSTPFQQMVNMSYAVYKGYANKTFNNVEFFYSNGTIIPSWLENYSYSKNALYWIKTGSIPASSSITVYMGFAPTSTNLFNTVNVGEAPQLSATYAEYDDGANVFNFYDNFAGTSLNTTKWNSYGSDQTSGSLSGISVNNSLSLTGGGTAGLSHETWIADTNIQWNSNIILDVYEDSPSASTTFRWGMTNTVPGTYFGGNPAFGIQAYKDGNWYTNAYSSAAIQNKIGSYPTNTYNIYSISATESRIIYYLNSYSSAPNAGQTITTNIPAFSSTIFLALTNAYTNPIYVRWVRTRAYPPNGVMPSVTFGTVS
ncbi:MAG: hypothetical protein BJBARM4_0839 [Candidatus Parvarchaeum acidiphilum ARMAN-4]|uniref:DUF2341 domain-containing protein n=1 Tax=Candidatus Parvarchaeum acidiphilum ARMAN-4 TaxID=662760 RepID=D2EGE0_PARA4|nr:MAG: hypothetical protein BJBARM4_0839 [Candidatus Parvarchaeum acidiphilum ARMAN-4]